MAFDATKLLSETRINDNKDNFQYIGISAADAGKLVDFDTYRPLPVASGVSEKAAKFKDGRVTLHFAPYYYRANRGGRGQMRVGFRRA